MDKVKRSLLVEKIEQYVKEDNIIMALNTVELLHKLEEMFLVGDEDDNKFTLQVKNHPSIVKSLGEALINSDDVLMQRLGEKILEK